MKKTLIILVSIISLVCFNQISAISVKDYSIVLNKRLEKMGSTEEKIKYLENLSESINTLCGSKNTDSYKSIRIYTLNLIEEIKSGDGFTTSHKNLQLPSLSDNIPNIDEQKVREAVLLWHNEERYNIGANFYTYNINLEGSANTRATKLANSHKINNLHLRNAGDGKYNYDSILNRFSDLGINLPKSVKEGTSFSESIGYGFYKCNKSDCTQELIDAIKTTWTGLIMKEKNYNGSHYRAAAMKHFTQMGIGIAIDKSNNRYYLVLHYAANF